MKLTSRANQLAYFELKQPVYTSFACGQLKTLPLNDGEFLSALLSTQERVRHNAFGSALSAACWLRGRFAAKQLIQRKLGFEAWDGSRLTLVSRNEQNQGIVPSVWANGQQLPIALSISHTPESVLVALVDDPKVRIGVDLVRLGSISKNVPAAWFSAKEREHIGASDYAAERIWAAKEAAYKTLNQGEGFAPLKFSVELMDQKNCNCIYRSPSGYCQIQLRTWITSDEHLAAFSAR